MMPEKGSTGEVDCGIARRVTEGDGDSLRAKSNVIASGGLRGDAIVGASGGQGETGGAGSTNDGDGGGVVAQVIRALMGSGKPPGRSGDS